MVSIMVNISSMTVCLCYSLGKLVPLNTDIKMTEAFQGGKVMISTDCRWLIHTFTLIKF